MRRHPRIAVVIPALNEASAIGRVIDEIPDCVDCIIVVDNGSDDDTAAVARAHGAKVVFESATGYGAACQTGIRHAAADLIAFIDADYSDYPADLQLLIDAVAAGRAELAIGARTPLGKSSPLLPHQRLGNALIVRLIKWLYGVNYRDLGPMRCIRRDVLERLGMVDRDYGWTVEMQLKAAKLGIAVIEIPVRCRQRIGKSKISGTMRGSIGAMAKIFYWLVRLFFTRQSRQSRR